MRQWSAILFLFIYTIGATELDQLLKFPLLVKHYIIHKQQNSGITVALFLQIHYLTPQPFDADYKEDMQLPFKQADDHCLALPTVLPEPMLTLCHEKEVGYFEYNLFNNPNIPIPATGEIFKPPKA